MSSETLTRAPGHPAPPKRRRKYLERSAGVRVVLQARDLELFRAFLSFRVATAATLFPLVAAHFGQPFVLWRRLNRLFHAGYLARPSAQELRVFAKRGGPLHVYALGTKGAHELRAAGEQVSVTDFDAKARGLTAQFLDHALLTTHAVSVLLAALRARPALRVHRVLPDGAFRTSVQVFDGREYVSRVIKPDSVLVVHEEERAQTTAFMIEADRGTMPPRRAALTQSSFLGKALAYFAYWQETDRFRAELGVDDFVVLTITPTTERLEVLRDVARQVDPEQRGTDIFWFTSADALHLDHPTSSLTEAIWTTASGSTGSLF